MKYNMINYCNIYRRKNRIGRFQFKYTRFSGRWKDQGFKNAKGGLVCTECRAILNISKSLNPREPSVNLRRSDVLINKAISLL